jgi:hypothetical protein
VNRSRWITAAVVLASFLVGLFVFHAGGDRPDGASPDSELPFVVEVIRDPKFQGSSPCVDPVPTVPFKAPPAVEGNTTVEIRVTGESAPIEGAVVRPGDGSLRRFETDAEGIARLPVAREVTRLSLLVEAESYEDQVVALSLPLPDRRYHVQLLPLTKVSGHLVWTDGTPVVGAPCQVWALHPGKREIPPIPNTQGVWAHRVPYSEGLSDAGGRFELTRPDRREFCHLQIGADGGLYSVSQDLVFDRRANIVLVPPGEGDSIVGTLTIEDLYVGVLTAHPKPGMKQATQWGLQTYDLDLDPFALEDRMRFSFKRIHRLGDFVLILRPRRVVGDPATVDLPVSVHGRRSLIVPLRVRPGRRFTEKDVTHFDLDISDGIAHVIRFPRLPLEEPMTVHIRGGARGEGPIDMDATGPASGVEVRLPPGPYWVSANHYSSNVAFDRVLIEVRPGSETVIEKTTPRCVLDIEILDQFGRTISRWMVTSLTGRGFHAVPAHADGLTRLPPGRELLLRAARCDPMRFTSPEARTRPQRLRFVLKTRDAGQ